MGVVERPGKATGGGTSGNDLSPAGKRELVQRISSSPLFSNSQAFQAFLLYITELAIAGRAEEIKEQRIGCEVLGRKADYDPAADNIVRVRAHELRNRLAKYFNTTGANEPFVITIPRGSYVPVFQPRPLVAPQVDEDLGSRDRDLHIPRYASWTDVQFAAIRDLWGQFLPTPAQDLAIVASDAAFALWQDITGQNLNLGDYLSRRYLEMGDAQLVEVAARRCMAPADLNIALHLVDVCDALGGRVKPQYARNLSMADLRAGSIVLLGSRRSNPWVQLFEPGLNFVLALDPPSGGPRFRNTSPLPGEPASFGIPCRLDIQGTERTEMESYALIALVANLSGTGHVLILEGLNMEATEAAGETVTNPERLATLLRQTDHKPGTPVEPFEALIQLTSMPGGYANPRLVTFRRPAISPDA